MSPRCSVGRQWSPPDRARISRRGERYNLRNFKWAPASSDRRHPYQRAGRASRGMCSWRQLAPRAVECAAPASRSTQRWHPRRCTDVALRFACQRNGRRRDRAALSRRPSGHRRRVGCARIARRFASGRARRIHAPCVREWPDRSNLSRRLGRPSRGRDRSATAIRSCACRGRAQAADRGLAEYAPRVVGPGGIGNRLRRRSLRRRQ